MDDPILLGATAFMLVFTPVLSVLFSKLNLKLVFLPSVIFMIVSFPLFFVVMIAPTMPYGKELFLFSMSVWTGGFFTIFFALIYYLIKRK